jgi:hypothetical protein
MKKRQMQWLDRREVETTMQRIAEKFGAVRVTRPTREEMREIEQEIEALADRFAARGGLR